MKHAAPKAPVATSHYLGTELETSSSSTDTPAVRFAIQSISGRHAHPHACHHFLQSQVLVTMLFHDIRAGNGAD
jgi:hypothetical protein